MHAGRLPERRRLPHAVPPWVRQGARHFVTINGRQRGSRLLVEQNRASRLIESALFYDEQRAWYLWLMVVMPDHVHMIATFDLARGVAPTIAKWKGYQKKTLGIRWQTGFFEHRLRSTAEFAEKATYIRMNPVRRGLVADPESWPHVVDRTSLPTT